MVVRRGEKVTVRLNGLPGGGQPRGFGVPWSTAPTVLTFDRASASTGVVSFRALQTGVAHLQTTTQRCEPGSSAGHAPHSCDFLLVRVTEQ